MIYAHSLFCQQIVEAEYFFNTDPGFGAGTPIAITADQDVADMVVTIDINSLPKGIHNLIVRAKDENGSWSLTHKQSILKSPLPASSPIDRLEYYFDEDPGFGNGATISIPLEVDIQEQVASISAVGLEKGIHNLNIRAKNENNVWSHIQTTPVLVTDPISIVDIVALEYYIGEDPGAGNGNPISFSTANEVNNISAVIPQSELSFGINRISIRSKDVSGNWSHCHTKSVLRMKAPVLPDIVELEYFFDEDPGLGNGTFVSYSPDEEWSDISVIISTNGLEDGIHTLFIRSKDETGSWSFTNFAIIQKTTIVELSDIVKMEYFFDDDPGFGMGNNIPLSQNTEIGEKVVAISTSGLAKGIHTLFVRSKNALGNWSLTSQKAILINPPKIIEDIVAIEYYIDTDPGHGQGTEIDISALPQIADITSLIQTTGLSFGVHQLFLRSMDSKGRWSLSSSKSFLYRPPEMVENISKMEYFIGNDPGFGNGVDIVVPSFSPESDIMDLEQLIDINSLDVGVQRLSLRSRDELNVWSHTHVQPIYVYKETNGNMVKAEYFLNSDPGYGMGTEVSFSPVLDKSNHMFPIDVSGLEFGVHRLHVRYMSEKGKWSEDEITPFLYKDGELYTLVKGEYFFDMDPGLGMATPFTLPSDVDVADLDILVFTTGLDAGDHDLYIRTQNANQEWSLTNVEFDIEIENVLPLDFLSFSVEKIENTSLLEWAVNNAVNTSHFEIERAVKGEFSYIGEVESQNDLSRVEYKFIDQNPEGGWNYYRLKQLDQDGKFKYSAIRSLNFNANNDILVYPNPTYNEIYISGFENDQTSYTIYDNTNALVKRGNTQKSRSIDVSELLPGAYHLIVQNGIDKKSFLIIKI